MCVFVPSASFTLNLGFNDFRFFFIFFYFFFGKYNNITNYESMKDSKCSVRHSRNMEQSLNMLHIAVETRFGQLKNLFSMAVCFVDQHILNPWHHYRTPLKPTAHQKQNTLPVPQQPPFLLNNNFESIASLQNSPQPYCPTTPFPSK